MKPAASYAARKLRGSGKREEGHADAARIRALRRRPRAGDVLGVVDAVAAHERHGDARVGRRGAQRRRDLVLAAEEDETGRCGGDRGEEVGEVGGAVGHGLLHGHGAATLGEGVGERVGEALRHRLGLAHDGHAREAARLGLHGEELGLQ